MSADNWTICPMCVKRAEKLREEFIKKYYGNIDSYLYNDILKEINDAVAHIKSYGSDEHTPSEKIMKAMDEKNMFVKLNDEEYDADFILQRGQSGATLREDYEQGVSENGNIYFIYGCQCECGFSKKVNYDESKNNIIDKPKEEPLNEDK